MRALRASIFQAAVVSASVGLLVGVTPASADSTDNDGINIGNDNNLSVLPVQLCGNNVAVLGLTAPIGSPQSAECTNAPIVDHPEANEPPAEEPPVEEPPEEEHPGENPPAPEPPTDESPEEVPPAEEPPADDSSEQEEPSTTAPTTDVQDESEELPVAPTPVAVEGHHAVTG